MSDSTDTTEHASLPNDSGAAMEHTDRLVQSADEAAVSTGGADEAGKNGGQRPSRTELLEEEGDIAADYLEELLDIADLDGDIDIDVADGRAQLAEIGRAHV